MATIDRNFGEDSRFDHWHWLVPPEERGCPHVRLALARFCAGARLCPGPTLALREIRTVLAMLCGNFGVEPVGIFTDPMVTQFRADASCDSRRRLVRRGFPCPVSATHDRRRSYRR